MTENTAADIYGGLSSKFLEGNYPSILTPCLSKNSFNASSTTWLCACRLLLVCTVYIFRVFAIGSDRVNVVLDIVLVY